MCSSKGFSCNSPAISTQSGNRVDQQFHRVDAVARRSIKMSQLSLSRQQDVVHAPDPLYRVMKANSHTRPENGVDNSRFLAGMKPAYVNADQLPHFGGLFQVNAS